MRTFLFLIIVVLFFGTVATALAADQFQLERPEWRIGDTWTWEVKKDGASQGKMTISIEKEDAEGYVAKRTDGRGEAEIYYNKDLNVKEIFMKNGSLKYNPNRPVYFWPLKPDNIQRFYTWQNDIDKISRGERVQVDTSVDIITNDRVRISMVLHNHHSTNWRNRLWEEKDTIIYSAKIKNCVNAVYDMISDKHTYEYTLLTFEEGR